MSAVRKLLVCGSTGKQGGALISALVANASHPFEIYAVTRNIQSKSAQRLASQRGVRLIQGDFAKDVGAIFRQIKRPLHGVFIMTDQMVGEEKETAQGKGLVDAAVEAGVKHIVFSATDRSFPSDTTPTNVPHFRSKYHIEQDIIARAKESGGQLTYTFLRPVAFFDNWTRDFFGKAFTAMFKQNGVDRKLQFVSTADIGIIAADSISHASEERYKNVGISLAGDEISPMEAAQIFRQTTGEEIPETYGIVGSILKRVVPDLGYMFAWFKSNGFEVDIKALKKQYPFMRDFEGWLREESAWKDQAK